jgi:hydroxymethylpyrimidine pyrophosphatase-like HAD family hydrolase
MISQGHICVDLDGTLAEYDGWVDATHIGFPVNKMLERIKRWLAEGQKVKIFTARVSSTQAQAELARNAIQNWCRVYIGQELDVTAEKDTGCIEIWDDRAVQVEKNTGRRMDGIDD